MILPRWCHQYWALLYFTNSSTRQIISIFNACSASYFIISCYLKDPLSGSNRDTPAVYWSNLGFKSWYQGIWSDNIPSARPMARPYSGTLTSCLCTAVYMTKEPSRNLSMYRTRNCRILTIHRIQWSYPRIHSLVLTSAHFLTLIFCSEEKCWS